MKKNDLDLSKLKQEIENRKNDRFVKDKKLGIESNTQNIQKYNFLKGLLDAYNTMNENNATKHIKQVVKRSDDFSSDPIMQHVNTSKDTTEKNSKKQIFKNENIYDLYKNNNIINDVGLNNDRDDELFREIERRTKEYNERAGKQIFPLVENKTNISNNKSAGDFKSDVISIIEEYLGNNFRKIIKDVIYEIYINENVKNGILNNEDVIKNIVIETIKSLKRKKTN